jgi:hypothetical protein
LDLLKVENSWTRLIKGKEIQGTLEKLILKYHSSGRKTQVVTVLPLKVLHCKLKEVLEGGW